jgi:hypothetical protein
MDFVTDALFSEKRFRALTIVSISSRENLAIVPGQELKVEDVVRICMSSKTMRHICC